MGLKLALLVATGLYSGYTPLAPGTVGSIACLLFWYCAALIGLWDSYVSQVLIVFTCIVVGYLAAKKSLPVLVEKYPQAAKVDPQVIVIDEWAGLLISLIGVSAGQWEKAALAFVLFRFFDVTKLGPISRAEKLPGAWGIMLDDVVAGIFAAVILNLSCYYLA